MRLPLLVASALLLAGCSSGDDHDTHDETYDIAIHGSQFDPTRLTMPAEHTLRFENHDSFRHSATILGGLDSGDIGPDGSHEFANMQPGTYTFKCKYHSNMQAVVTVQAT